MTYDEKYDAMPLRGKIGPGWWELENLGYNDWGESCNRGKRKLCRHHDPYKDWWKDDTIGRGWHWMGHDLTKGKKPKTWRDYR